jgi:hypothetical protein
MFFCHTKKKEIFRTPQAKQGKKKPLALLSQGAHVALAVTPGS